MAQASKMAKRRVFEIMPIGLCLLGGLWILVAGPAHAGAAEKTSVRSGKAVISTVVGNGTPDFKGDGGAAASASLSNPRAVTVDATGNLYISDSTNNRVRKVDGTTGVITTVAGNGTRDFSGDGGLATKASLAFPMGLTVDTEGNLFIADARNHRIRRVDAKTGIITTVAGQGIRGLAGDNGPALSALLSYPTAVALDEEGNLYIADSENGGIRRVDRKTGIISSVVGEGTPGAKTDAAGTPTIRGLFVAPVGLTYDGKGSLYVADSFLNRIKKVEVATRKVTIVAGKGANQYCGDGGPAKEACLAQPAGVALDAAGNVYIADAGNNRVRKVDAKSGLVTTVAGSGERGFAGDHGPATKASLGFPTGVAIDPKGRVVVVEPNNNRVRRLETNRG
jgi:sugar lactone lactonase YvrE